MLKYIGKGFLTGIPARDLSEHEIKMYGGERFLLATGMWVRPKPKKKKVAEKKIEIVFEDGE
jgi:hypothetical protein